MTQQSYKSFVKTRGSRDHAQERWAGFFQMHHFSLHWVRSFCVRLKLSRRMELGTARLTREVLMSLGLRMRRGGMLHQCFLRGELRSAGLALEFWHAFRLRKLNYRINRLGLMVKSAV